MDHDKSAIAAVSPKVESTSGRLLGAAGRATMTATGHCLAFTAIFLVMSGPVQSFDEMYVEHGGKYPVLTVLIVNQGRWLKYYGWLLMYLPAILINAGVLFVLNLLPPKWRWVPRGYASLVLLLSLLYVCLAFFAMSLPLQLGLGAPGNEEPTEAEVRFSGKVEESNNENTESEP